MRITRAKGIAIVVAACAALAAGALAASATGARWVIRGHGFGHGVGMSQYGAYGYAKHGRDYRSILKHYYRNTRIATANDSIKVLLASGRGSVGFSNARKACGKRLRSGRGYQFAESGSDVLLRSTRGRKLANCGRKGTARGGHGIRVEGKGTYRGKLVAKASGGLLVVNKVGLDDYAQGVIANEMPSSWPQHALRAQAVASRSYGLSSSGGRGFDVYDDTRSQVYGGKGSETSATNRAVRKTSRQILRYHKKVITAFFFSTSGGRTESIQYAFGGSPVPYLKSVKDPYDDTSPYHSWKVRYSQGEMESRLSGLFRGRLKKVKVTKTGDSPRIVKAKVVGSRDSSRVSGSTLQGRLGLMSTWARFRR
ncbi:MAG TPA: SpoIID/LytB domain-containing protein [Solirubrobacterales bacterium]|nr:SpoIID/LytB domain-containing protein [Solirubrobacterales bacterium]